MHRLRIDLACGYLLREDAVSSRSRVQAAAVMGAVQRMPVKMSLEVLSSIPSPRTTGYRAFTVGSINAAMVSAS